jgi:AAA15 family ATPase/GTPase
MIIDFSFSNFRSIKDEQFFSMEAEASKSKLDNTFEITLADKTDLKDASSVKLLKSAVVYGANSSGKSNFIRALYALRFFIVSSDSFKVGKDIICYEPFELEKGYEDKTTKFQISFIANDSLKYQYEIEFDKKEVYVEKLSFYPKGKTTKLFERISDNSNNAESHRIQFGDQLEEKPRRKTVFKNQLYLSKFGSDEPNEQLTPIYRYFDDLEIWNAIDKTTITRLTKSISEEISKTENIRFANRLSKLIKIADTKIESIFSAENQIEEIKFVGDFSDELKEEIRRQNKFRPFATHIIYENEKEVDTTNFDVIKKESAGTNVLFALGGLILQKLESGGVIIFDELDNSLHPKLCKFLIRLFNNPVSNPNNAQLIFATHEVTLLDKGIFRKDQIWFTEKNKFGQTELFSAQDIEGLRDDTNFEVWYRTGKFGGNPNIKEVEFIFGDE